jgi:hypothetical protein
MNLDTKVEPKKHRIQLTLKNDTEAVLKLHSYASSAPPLSELPDTLSYLNENAPGNNENVPSVNLEFELPQDSNHGIWIRYRYVDNVVCGFDVRISARFSKHRDIDVNTDVYYVEGQGEKKLLSREATYTMYDDGKTTHYQVNECTYDEEVGPSVDTAFGARVLYGTVNADGWDLCASIEAQFLITEF